MPVGTASVDLLADEILRDFQTLASAFTSHRVNFTIKRYTKGFNYIVEITTDDTIYGYIEDGTSVRYATMTDGFRPKTWPNTLATQPGAGHVAFVSRRIKRPGIAARNFSQAMITKHEGKLDRIAAEVISEIGDAALKGLP